MDTMEQDTVEVYSAETGERIHERTIFVPAPPPTHPARLMARIAGLEAERAALVDASIAALDPTANAAVKAAALAKLRALRKGTV